MTIKQMENQFRELTQLIDLLEDAYRKEIQAGNDIAKDLKLSLDRAYDKYYKTIDIIHSI